MRASWSLSEFLSLFELRGQAWCHVALSSVSGFRIPHKEAVFFYAVERGSATIAGVSGGAIELQAGDAVMIASGEAHTVRASKGSPVECLPFLAQDHYADDPPHVAVGGGGSDATRLLCGRLKVRWPTGARPRAFPAALRVKATDNMIHLPTLISNARGPGAADILTRAAMLMFANATRDHPLCPQILADFNLQDPIARARFFMERHPFRDWTVEVLARKVGMGRSNFATRFVKEVGRTPMEALTDERMQHAAQLLATNSLKVTEISERVGYRSEAAFIRRFTSHFGMTPGQMRRQKQQA